LYNGSPPNFAVGDSYTIYHDYVYSRKYVLHAKFNGDQETRTLSETRVRDVCLGYTAGDCSTMTAAINFFGNGGTPLITIQDYEEDEVTEVGLATFTPSAASSGWLKVSDIDYYLTDAVGEIPDWFITNKWHQFVGIVYSAGDSPNGGATCTVGADCLTLTSGGVPNNNKRALVVSAGEPLAAQDRTSGSANDYYEDENIDAGDDDYQTGDITGTFNDQVRVLDTPP